MLYTSYHMVSLSANTSAPYPYPGYVSKQVISTVDFPQRLADLRKQHSLTQAQLAVHIAMHVAQFRWYMILKQ